ncbi:HAD-IC family P-type ATPase [Sphaerisporangium krabiense]|uniref:Cation-transporting ATPase I n=1 Tax=Sphaerisporangium krabiense TaxID=763782 RepID=A0A7W8YZC5_9ACTN|nr:HAD-IC family P-type ATPase [Sphaerisporangium krabiense]MBB5624482.1 cation-transporting ATPase I [Sphaerisporangium krabiense]
MALRHVLASSASLLRAALPGPLGALLPPHPRVAVPCPGGVHVDLYGIGGPGTEKAAQALERRLRAVPGVERAEVNGRLGRVLVTVADGGADLETLTAVVEEMDPRPEDAPRPPAGPVERHARAAVRLAASVAAAGLAVAGQVARIHPVDPLVPALGNLAASTPFTREAVEDRLGRAPAEALFMAFTLTTQALTARPLGLVAQAASSLCRYVEARAVRASWSRAQERLAATPGAYHHVEAGTGPRPGSLRHGPAEKYGQVAGPAILAVYGGTRLLTPHGRRALSLLVAATPKIAGLTRDAFAGVAGRALAARDALVLDATALRLMDRADTVILDAAVLTTGGWTIDRVEPLAEGPKTGELYARLHSLIDLSDPGAAGDGQGWSVTPLADLDRLPSGDAAVWRERGLRAFEVRRDGTPVAVAGLAREAEPLAEAVVAAAKAAGTVLLAGEAAVARRFAVGEVIPAEDLAAHVARLQARGHGVVVVSRDAGPALAMADIGVGVPGAAGALPWDADVVTGPSGVHLILSCLPRAVRASTNGVRLGAVAAVVGGLLAIAGPEATALRRAYVLDAVASLTAVALGEWAGRVAARVPVPPPADVTPWHAMSVKEVLALLGSSADGISGDDAERRRTAAGAPEARPRSLARTTAEELANPLTPALAAGAVISALVGSVLDAVMISAVMLTNALLGGVQRFRADRALHRLTEATEVRVRLRRPDGVVSATKDDLAPGDVVELRAGDAVPADARVIKADGLEVDESTLTGESQLVTKTAAPTVAAAVADRASMVYQGTTVAAGSARAVIVATGELTEAGRSARLAAEPSPPTGVELRLRELSRRTLPVSIAAGVVLLLTDLLRGRPLAAALTPAVSLTVAAVPEGLPFVATLAELAAARRLSKRAALVRNPSTIEALGRVNVLCFDKTGTLTEGRIRLRYISDGRHGAAVEKAGDRLRRVLAAAVRASPRTGGGRVIAHPTDRAVLDGAERIGVTPGDGLDRWERVDVMPFEPGRGYHAVLGATGEGQLLTVKGAPEILLTRCDRVLRDGTPAPLDEAARRALEDEVDRLARQGYRVLAVAERRASDRGDLDESRVDELCFLGFLGLADPVRPTAAESVRRLARAGVRVVMVTGDHPSTAEAIAVELDALDGRRVMTGPELEEMDDESLTKVLPEVAVFARATPAHKARIVTCLRKAGEVVAVTGDGANDAPAIRMADVGIALGSRATPAARAAADLVVTDDRIETIVDAIVEGRAMWSSVRDALSILLGGNVGEIVFTVGTGLLAGGSALNARQLLLVNLLTDMAPALAVAVRPPASTDPDKLLAEGPEASLGESLTRDIYLRSAVTASAAIAAWAAGRLTGTQARANTIGLVALVAAQLFQTVAQGGRDRVVVAATLASLVMLVVVVSVPGVSTFFGSRPLGPVGWSIALGCAAAATYLGPAAQDVVRRARAAAPAPAPA